VLPIHPFNREYTVVSTAGPPEVQLLHRLRWNLRRRGHVLTFIHVLHLSICNMNPGLQLQHRVTSGIRSALIKNPRCSRTSTTNQLTESTAVQTTLKLPGQGFGLSPLAQVQGNCRRRSPSQEQERVPV
jgi:hypothetical protein